MAISTFALLLLSGCYTVVGGNNSINNGKESDATVKKEIKIGDFNEVSVSQGIKVIFAQDDNTGTASIATTPSAEKYLRVEVKNETLNVYYDVDQNGKKINIKGPSIVRVASQTLSGVKASSGAEFNVKGNFKGSEGLNVSLSSGAEFETDGNIQCAGEIYLGVSSAASFDAKSITCDMLRVDASSGSDVEVKILSGNLEVSASSGSDIEFNAVNAKTVSLRASSGSDIDVDNISADAVSAKASSGADISLSGTTEALDQNSSSGGSVKTKGLKVN